MNPYFKRILYCLLVFIPGLVMTTQVYAVSLKNHPSPYLNLHANDPVEWQVWGKDVLQQAKAQNKLVYLSIGYFSCHWCHVMQKESYADAEIGAFLNKHYIPVKVDRELRPELDRRMIQFVEAIRGQAGWPLNVFITADGYPVTGFTYLPRDNFLDVLTKLDEQWQQNHTQIKLHSKAYFEQSESIESRSTLVSLPDKSYPKVVDAFVSQAMQIADELQGGFGQSNKFPSYPQLNALLRIVSMTPDIDPDVVDFLQLTLDIMASRHLMDHVNSGFFRYVTDPDWETPHFEKMLYDNAQLASLYFDAAAIWPDKGYAQIGLKTVQFIHRFLANDSGGFNASLSAVDVNNVEGGAYYWSVEELGQVLTQKELRHLQQIWGLRAEQKHSIQINPLTGPAAPATNKELNEQILQKLQGAERPVMPVDNKRLASWNALLLKALIKAERYDRNPERARKQTDSLYAYISRNFIQDHKVVRFAGQAESAETTLADYAHVAHALQSYADARDNNSARQQVRSLVKQAFDLYYRDGRWIQDTESLIPADRGDWILQDGVLETPVTLLLETVFMMQSPDASIKKIADELLIRLTPDVLELPFHYASSIVLRQQYKKAAPLAAQQ